MPSDEQRKPSQWAPLLCERGRDCIELYYDYVSSASGLCLSVTDLCFVWEIFLTRVEVLDEAQEQNCSIDPAESTKQFHTLLAKLEQSLKEGHNEVGSRPSQGLAIRTRLKLPTPLKLLMWTFQLQQQDGTRLAELITLPLLREAALMKRQMQTLFRLLKDKDHVLSKLLDKIDNSAIDLSLVFPGINGIKSRKQRMSIPEASKHVSGMAAFDRNVWEAEFAKQHNGLSSKSTSFSDVLSGINAGTVEVLRLEEWFQTLPELVNEMSALYPADSNTNDNVHDLVPPTNQQADETGGNDSCSAPDSDFENLADTPRRRKQNKRAPNDEERLPPVRRSYSKESLTHSSLPASRPGTTSRKCRISHCSSDSSSDSSSKKVIRRVGKTGTKAGGKIGMLGGRTKASAVRQSSPVLNPTSSTASTPSRKLGVLGGQSELTKSPSKLPVAERFHTETLNHPFGEAGSDTASNASSPRVSTMRKPVTPTRNTELSPACKMSEEIEESIEAKAHRKREELKRTQAQATAGLAKKKARRF